MYLLVFLICLFSGVNSYNFDTNCKPGRSSIVQLFEWRYDDIAEECENFLGPYGYCGVQTSVPTENVVVWTPKRPWWERYQAVSYKFNTRSGSEADLKSMILRCNKVGVNVYPDTLVNHMSGVGFSGNGTGGCFFDGHEGKLWYPCVPYGINDFHNSGQCHTGDQIIHNYGNKDEVRNCRLAGDVSLADLKTESDYVRSKIAEYMNVLIGFGVAGFRIDAAKHVPTGDLQNIFGRLKKLRKDLHGDNKRPAMFLEVPAGSNEAVKLSDYFFLGKVANKLVGAKLSPVFRKQNPMKYLSNWGPGWGLMDGLDSLTFMDNHDTQRCSGSGCVLTFREPRNYKLANAFMLAHPYGFTRIMSSFSYSQSWEGPPHYANYSTQRVQFNSDLSCKGKWVCEHRWRQIYNMVAFRNAAAFSKMVNFAAPKDYQIAFAREKKGFIALNLEDFPMTGWYSTSLPGGVYCDVITGNLVNGTCTGKNVTVQADGRVPLNVCGKCEDSMLAIHIGAKAGGSGNTKRF